ncbi:MAG: DUF983 domain-containing protein [Parvularculaceae bacterium]
MTSSVQTFGRTSGDRPWKLAVKRGMALKCPQCGEGRLLAGYLKVRPACSHCGLDFSGHRADDAPPYITISIVGHVAVTVVLAMKEAFDATPQMQLAVALPLAVIMMAFVLPASKGGLIGLQWRTGWMVLRAPRGTRAPTRKLNSGRSQGLTDSGRGVCSALLLQLFPVRGADPWPSRQPSKSG